MNVFYTVSICCEVSSHWSVFVLVFLADIASSTIKSFVEFLICFTCVLYIYIYINHIVGSRHAIISGRVHLLCSHTEGLNRKVFKYYFFNRPIFLFDLKLKLFMKKRLNPYD